MHFRYDEGSNDEVKSNYEDLRLHSDGSIGKAFCIAWWASLLAFSSFPVIIHMIEMHTSIMT